MRKVDPCNILLKLNDVEKIYSVAGESVVALKKISLEVSFGEVLAITGPSGSGKSTLLHIMGGLEKPTRGEVKLLGDSISSMSDSNRTRLRRESLGFVYQFHHLLPEFNVLENVLMPLLVAGICSKDEEEKAKELLSKVGLSKRTKHLPSMLSGGERQRVAIARSVVNAPKLVLADEPTGNLDNENANQIFSVLLDQAQENQSALIIVTHDLTIAAGCSKTITLI